MVEGRPLFAHSCILVARCEPLEKDAGWPNEGRLVIGNYNSGILGEWGVIVVVINRGTYLSILLFDVAVV